VTAPFFHPTRASNATHNLQRPKRSADNFLEENNDHQEWFNNDQ